MKTLSDILSLLQNTFRYCVFYERLRPSACTKKLRTERLIEKIVPTKFVRMVCVGEKLMEIKEKRKEIVPVGSTGCNKPLTSIRCCNEIRSFSWEHVSVWRETSGASHEYCFRCKLKFESIHVIESITIPYLSSPPPYLGGLVELTQVT